MDAVLLRPCRASFVCAGWLDFAEAVRPQQLDESYRNGSTATNAVQHGIRMESYAHPGVVRGHIAGSNDFTQSTWQAFWRVTFAGESPAKVHDHLEAKEK